MGRYRGSRRAYARRQPDRIVDVIALLGYAFGVVCVVAICVEAIESGIVLDLIARLR